MGVRRRCDQEIHYPRSRSACPALGNRGGELPVADRHIIVDRESIELSLEVREPPQSLRPDGCVSGDEHAEVQLSERGRADRKFPLELGHVGGEQDAGVKERLDLRAPTDLPGTDQSGPGPDPSPGRVGHQ